MRVRGLETSVGAGTALGLVSAYGAMRGGAGTALGLDSAYGDNSGGAGTAPELVSAYENLVLG